MTRFLPFLRSMLLPAVLLAVASIGLTVFRSAAEEARQIPAPSTSAANAGESEVAVLAGGCFWGVQGVYQHVTGVSSAVSGYAGGDEKTANYDMVSDGITDHAESVKVVFDPRRISYAEILHIYFSVVHDPTQLNRQGPDVGPQYRSTIFPQSAQQAQAARDYIAELEKAKAFPSKIVTTIEPDRAFYPAEAYHQDYMTRYPTHPYIAFHDIPKVEALKKLFPAVYRDQPVLVSAK